MSILSTATRHREFEIVEKVVVKKNTISILEQPRPHVFEFDLQILTSYSYIYFKLISSWILYYYQDNLIISLKKTCHSYSIGQASTCGYERTYGCIQTSKPNLSLIQSK